MKKICVRAPQWLGDAVVSTVFITALKRLQPDSEISVVCKSFLANLFKAHPDVKDTIPLTRSVREMGECLKEKKFDEIYILPKSARSMLEALFSGIPRRVGFRGALRRFFLTESYAYPHKRQYPERYLALLGRPLSEFADISPYFPHDPNGVPALKNAARPILGIAPKSVAPAPTWAPERFAETANEFIREKKGTVILFGIESERPVTAAVKRLINGPVIDLTGKVDMATSAVELGAWIKGCDYFLVNDSGLMHISSALHVPTIVLFGASDPTYALPRVPSTQAIHHTEISCVPCYRNHCVRFGGDKNACLKAITPGEVMEKLN